MLKIQNISFSIEGKPIFENASALIPIGHKIGIVGRNGTGKTSLFRLIRGEWELDSGQIEYPSYFRVGGVEQEASASHTNLLDIVLAADSERSSLLMEVKTTKAPEQEKVYDTNCSGGGYGVNCTTSERQNPNAAAGVIGHAIGQALANAMIKKSRRKSCMKDKGYKLVHANSVSKKTDKENPEYLKIPEGIEEGSVEHTMWLNGIEKDAEDL